MVIMPVHVNIMHIFDAPIAEMESETDSQSSWISLGLIGLCTVQPYLSEIKDIRWIHAFNIDTVLYCNILSDFQVSYRTAPSRP